MTMYTTERELALLAKTCKNRFVSNASYDFFYNELTVYYDGISLSLTAYIEKDKADCAFDFTFDHQGRLILTF